MADNNAQAGPVLADDLMRDRSRRFVEFLDDDVSRVTVIWHGGQPRKDLHGHGADDQDECRLQLPRVDPADAGQ